jgi:pullulanase/glycogen debranching enzyme
MPEGWRTLAKPPLAAPEDIVLYELHVRDFSASDPEVRRLASEFAAEETEHVEAIDDWLARTDRPSAPWAVDPHRGG